MLNSVANAKDHLCALDQIRKIISLRELIDEMLARRNSFQKVI
jgi:hypothetical protein